MHATKFLSFKEINYTKFTLHKLNLGNLGNLYGALKIPERAEK
jgi:hypothetical protein